MAIALLPLETPRLRLRPLVAEDAERLHAVYAAPRVEEWIGPHELDEVRAEIAGHAETLRRLGYAMGAVEERASGAFLGDCGLQPFEHTGPEVELGYDLDPACWGQGYATEAARACLDAAFARLGLERVIAVVLPDNRASRCVLEKAGLELEGERRAYGADMLLYAAERARRA
jgi:ribosomal-protein-alanine N-acetyltransferase